MRGCDCVHQGKYLAASWISHDREGMLEQGGKGLFVHSDIIEQFSLQQMQIKNIRVFKTTATSASRSSVLH